ncbi:hypothetical protein AB0Q95_25330 [Streptomyces sp. NPDC059900]
MDMTELEALPSAALTHERNAYARRVLDGAGPLAERLTARGNDIAEGDLR